MRKIDYETEYNRLLKHNISSVRNEIDGPYMHLKIERFAKKFGLDFSDIKNKILKDDIFAMVFAKDPSKQSYNQSFARSFIEENPRIKTVEQLPAMGSNALYVINGKILTFTDLTEEDKLKRAKSIDFFWEVVGESGIKYKFYASHKYTKEFGGAQDNQYNDICGFMREASSSTKDNIFFLAICDGEYYQYKKRCEPLNKIEIMNRDFGTDYCVALTSNDIDEFIENRCK